MSSIVLGTVKAVTAYGIEYIRTSTAISGFLSSGMAICFKFPGGNTVRAGFMVIHSSDSSTIVALSNSVAGLYQGDQILPYSSDLVVYINGRPRSLIVKP